MLRLFILILIQLTYTRSTTNPYVTYYWKTTSVTDKVVDYWNHGPIYIPGLQDVFPMTTKQVDEFPPWLTESKQTTNYKLKDIQTFKPKTKTTQRIEETTPKITTTTTIASTTVTETVKPTGHTTHDVTKTTHKTEATKRTTTKELFDFEEAPINENNITLSEFLRRVLRALAVKNYSELPPLFKPFNDYVRELLTDGDFNGLGTAVISTLEDWNGLLSRLIKSPDKLHAECYRAHLALSKRDTELNGTVNNLINFLDDMYDEAEEEFMMFILQETIKFPNTNTTAEEIAFSFVNNVFLNPWNRINGTSKQDTLVKMLTEFFGKKPIVTRRHYAGNTYRQKRSRSDQHQKIKLRNALSKITENNYKAVRSNMDNIDAYMDKLDATSLDTSAYEYDMKANYDESDILSVLKLKLENKTKNNQMVLRTNIVSDDESSSANNDYNKPVAVNYDRWKETNNIRNLFDNLENIFKYSPKSSGTPKESSIQFRGDYQKYTNFEHTSYSTGFVPSRFLVTKLISKPVPYVGTTSPKKLRITYFSEATTDTQPNKDQSPSSKSHKVRKYKIKTERDPHFTEIPRYQRHKKYPAHLQPIPEFIDKPVARVPHESRPADSNTDGQVETALKDITLKRFNNQTKITNQRDFLKDGDMKVPRVEKNRKNITKHNAGVKHQEYVTDDSETYSESSPESLDKPSNSIRKSKYERLKRKYNILKRLNAKIMSQYIVNSKLKQSTLGTISSKQSTSGTVSNLRENVVEKNAARNGSDEFYHQIYKTTRNELKKVKINSINLFLNDYNGGVEIESDIQEPQAKPEPYKYILRKSFPVNSITHNNTNVTETDYSDAEKELKQNIYDAFRHMDFVNYNASRRSEDGPVEVGSYETDLEAVLKTNIYKAVKTLLKT